MEECIRLSEMAGFMVPQLVTRADLALIYAQLGDREEALALMSLVMKRVGPMGLTLENYFAGASALIRLAAGDVAGASRSLRVWDDRLEEPPRSLVDPPIYQAAVELALAQGDGESALTKANRLLRYLRSKGARLYMLPALLQKGHALMSLDRPDDARQTLLEAGELAQAVGARWTMWQAEAWLGRLAADPGERATHLDSARALIRSIADHTPEPLRDALLGRADVESLIDLAVD